MGTIKDEAAKIKPYNGDEPYIFISYCHADYKKVYPIIKRMTDDGYRLWFDEGIDPGTEWDDAIAEHVENCGYFIFFLSSNSLQSTNCRDELNFARDLDKKRFLVYIEQVQLTGGLRLRLGRIQNIHEYTYSDREDFFNKLYQADGISKFKSEPINSTSIAPTPKIQKAQPKSSPIEDFEIKNGVLNKYIGKDSKVVIPNSVTSIRYGAFYGCSSLTSINIPNRVIIIGEKGIFRLQKSDKHNYSG